MANDIINLVIGVKSGKSEDFETLKSIYQPMLSSAAAAFERSGAGSKGDLEEEAESALLRAALTFDEGKEDITFGLYAKICVRNALISIRRKKLSREAKARKIESVGEVKRYKRHIAFEGLSVEEIIEKVGTELSPYEKSVLVAWQPDKSSRAIASELGTSERSVNNALYRSRRKIKDKVL